LYHNAEKIAIFIWHCLLGGVARSDGVVFLSHQLYHQCGASGKPRPTLSY